MQSKYVYKFEFSKQCSYLLSHKLNFDDQNLNVQNKKYGLKSS